MHCRKLYNEEVLPVFYHVNPSHVRRQEGAFGNSFASLVNRISAREDTVNNWRKATQVSEGSEDDAEEPSPPPPFPVPER